MEELEEDDINEEEEEDDYVSDAESKVIEPLYVNRVPPHRLGPYGPMPPRAQDIERWRRLQQQPHPYGMEKRFYELRQGGPTDRALPVVVRRIGDIGYQAQVIANLMVQMKASLE